jgi:hypothetical protein
MSTFEDYENARHVALRSMSQAQFDEVMRGSRKAEALARRHAWWVTLNALYGWPPGRIARATGVHRSTVGRALLASLSADGPPK